MESTGDRATDPIQPGIRRFRRRVALLSALCDSIRFLALWCLLWGTAVLVLRAGFEAPRQLLLWGLGGILPVLAAALVLGWRRRPSERSVRALFDLHNRGGGLVMAGGEVDLGGWRDRIGPIAAPRLAARAPAGLLAGGAAFVAASFLMPVLPPGLADERPLEVGREIAELSGKIEVMQEEELLPEDEAERFESELAELSGEASGEDPAATWEALDHLQEMTDRAVADVAEAALAEGERLAAAEAVAEALADGAGEGAEELLAEAMAELSALTARTAAESRLLDPSLAAALGEGAADPAGLGELLEALRRGQGSLGDKLERLYAKGLIDLETLLAAKRSLEGDLESLAAFLEENDLEAASGFCRGGRPGQGERPWRGGVERGRGDAPMTWADPSSQDGVKFREQVLDPATLSALHDSRLLGLTTADPTSPDAPGAAPDPRAVDADAVAGGGAAYTHTLLPRHRGAVRRYFDRPAGEGDRP